MGSCYYFKKGYFGVCIASESEHVPSIAEMEEFCFRQNSLCPIFQLYTFNKNHDGKPELKHSAFQKQ